MRKDKEVLKLNDAVAVLQKQIDRLSEINAINYDGYNGWLSTTVSFYIEYFKKDSEECRYFNIHGHANDSYAFGQDKISIRTDHLKALKNKLIADIETLKIKGLPKEPINPKTNIVSHFNNYGLLATAIALLSAGFFGHKLLVDTIKDNLSTPPTELDSNKKTNSETDSTKYKNGSIDANSDSNNLDNIKK